ncbi:MAG: proton glutamate symport protein, partial [Candidatus Marinamargulisbacteria bacterium]
MRIKLNWQIFIAMALGGTVGYLSRKFGFEEIITGELAAVGTLFLRALGMIIVPLIVTSIISGMTAISSSDNFGKLSLKTVIFFLSSSLAAILTGIFLVTTIKPGVGADIDLGPM